VSSPSLYRRFISARTTVFLLCVLALLLLLNVALPQEAVLGPERYEAVLKGSGPIAHFFLETLGFGHMSTSPVFLAVLGLFFLNLAAVLASRVGPTWRRIGLKPRPEEGLKAWARMEESFKAPVQADFGPRKVAQTLRGFGYQVRKVGEKTFWGVKHRTAPLGFLLFHLSFFLICAGGLLIYYTRFIGTVIMSEGQQFDGTYSQVLRRPPMGGTPDLSFSVESIETRLEGGEPVHLEATFLLRQAGVSSTRTSRVNHPAKWGTSSILVERAGLAPVLWLQDPAGFTLDRVVTPVKTRSDEPTLITMAEERLNLVISPLGPETEFPDRDELPQTSLYFQLLGEDESLWSGALKPGEAASFEGGRMVLEEMRYWVGVRVVSERGGGLLIAGFTAGILGLIWRLLWYRREVAVTWDDSEFRLVGRSEYFSARFRTELDGIFQALQHRGTT
jgi:hypothetical protein